MPCRRCVKRKFHPNASVINLAAVALDTEAGRLTRQLSGATFPQCDVRYWDAADLRTMADTLRLGQAARVIPGKVYHGEPLPEACALTA